MIKNILWDFDGVILDSMKIKGDGFVELFSEYPKEDLEKIYHYHLQNGGMSRFKKIRYFYEQILQSPIEESEVNRLAENFGKIVSGKLSDKSNLIQDSINFIVRNHTRYRFHIVSGAEDAELNQLCKLFEIESYFISIHGSPTPKEELIKDILHDHHYKAEETILIGDSVNDLEAARANGIRFFGYNNKALSAYEYIETFEDFSFES